MVQGEGEGLGVVLGEGGGLMSSPMGVGKGLLSGPRGRESVL